MYHFVKRIFDIFSSIVGIIIFIPLYILIRLAYICTGDFHRIIYCQKRIGLHGKPFKMFKFRSMVINADGEPLRKLLEDPKYKAEWDEFHKIENDPRITKIGKFLRKSSLDEVPQFINVFIGQMSLVGNRPLAIEEAKKIQKRYLAKITSTKPGITGLWQVCGHNAVTFNDRTGMEIKYSDDQSFFLDLDIIFKTFLVILKRENK